MNDYTLTNSWTEAESRLKLLERQLDPVTIRHLQSVTVKTGHQCLELGAGGGSIARWLSTQVGTNGQVLAVDLDTSCLVADPAHANLEIVEANIADMALPADTYDVVHARLVLMHIAERDRVLARMVEAIKPGGWLVIEEGDLTNQQAYLPRGGVDSLYQEVLGEIHQQQVANGMSVNYGCQLPGLLAPMDLGERHCEGYFNMIMGASPEAEFLHLTYKQMRAAVLEHRQVSADDYDRFLALFHRADIVFKGPQMISVRAQKH